METNNEKHESSNSKNNTISIKIPKLSAPSIQSMVLILLIVVGGLQTVQLFGLSSRIASPANAKATVTKTATTPSAPSGAGGASLPKMVGGC